ncbi:hypothetical protein [Agromyces neolithicus]
MRTIILGEIARQRTARMRNRRLTIGAIALVAAIGTGASAIAITQATTREMNYSVDCYTVADLGAPHGTTTLLDGPSDSLLTIEDRAAGALAACETSWKAVPTEKEPSWRPIEVPNPTVCQLRDGRLAVFPNENNAPDDELCRQIGISVPSL